MFVFGCAGVAVCIFVYVAVLANVAVAVTAALVYTLTHNAAVCTVPSPCQACVGGTPCYFSGACSAKVGGQCSLGTVDCTDQTPPVITLIGDAEVTVEGGSGTYNDPGATAVDAVSGDVTSSVVAVGGALDLSVVGTTYIVYRAEDAAGNTATATRTVHVVGTSACAGDTRCGCA